MQNILTKINGMGQEMQVSSGKDEDEIKISMDARNIKTLNYVLAKNCKKCNSLKPPASHHCSICERCIARMDHHCPWVNNCVGFYNQKFFLQFLVYVALGSFHALVLTAWQSFRCFEQNCYIFRDTGTIILTGFAIFLAILFGLFVVIMFCDQMSCILYNTSTIDNLQKEKNPKMEAGKGQMAATRTAWQNVKEVFGGPVGIDWLLPTDVSRPLVFEREYD